MKQQPLLQFYSDETWGYNVWDEKKKKQDGISVKFQQEEEESREDFFARVGSQPSHNEYGSNIEYDDWCNDKDAEVRAEVAEDGYALERLIKDPSDRVRWQVAGQGYGLDVLVHDEDIETVGRALKTAEEGTIDPSVLRKIMLEDYSDSHSMDYDNDYAALTAIIILYHGFGLDILLHDLRYVEIVKTRLHYYEGRETLYEWMKQHPERRITEGL